MVIPVLIYGCEVGGFGNIATIERSSMSIKKMNSYVVHEELVRFHQSNLVKMKNDMVLGKSPGNLLNYTSFYTSYYLMAIYLESSNINVLHASNELLTKLELVTNGFHKISKLYPQHFSPGKKK